MSQPSQLHPRATVSTTQYHLKGDEVERVWQQLATMDDSGLQEALTLVLDWLYIGALASDARTAFLTYWMALEYLLRLGEARDPSEALPKWLRKEGARLEARMGGRVEIDYDQLNAFRLMRNDIAHEAGSVRHGQTVSEGAANDLRRVLTEYAKALLAPSMP